MDKLIAALQIFSKYLEKDSYQWKYPTRCEHELLYVCVHPDLVNLEDMNELENLGFSPDHETNSFFSHHYGSC